MNQFERRDKILGILKNSNDYINATLLAAEFNVTRQIIVSDIALLRATGNKIVATKRGYALEENRIEGIKFPVICRHSAENTATEFYAVVDNGGCVENVIVEHPLYGQISADLNIASRYDADEFIKKSAEVGASQLCELTNGIHIHMITAHNEREKERIIKVLSDSGILYSE